MQSYNNQISTVMKALGDENRLKILSMLESGSLCACNMLDNLGISQSTLSHHMAILSEAGLVSAWSVGKWTHYRLCTEGLTLAQSFLVDLQTAVTSQTLENSFLPGSQTACACNPETSTESRSENEMSIA